jgi:hypothetical protein
MRKLISVAVLLFCSVASLPPCAAARDDDGDSDSDLTRLERRQQELFLPDEVLDPSFAPLEVPFSDELLSTGNSDSVTEEPLDPDEPEAAEQQKVIAGEIKDDVDQAMDRDHFDDATTPFGTDSEGVGQESRDPVEW